MKAWLRQFRRYLIAAPLVLVVGFGWNVWSAWHGNDGLAHRVDDVPKGGQVRWGPATFQLASLKVEQPRRSSTDIGTPAPRGAVVVVATFRARVDDGRGYKDLYCDSHVQNSQGWQWPAATSYQQYLPARTSNSCDGKTLDKNFKNVVPQAHTWYDFAFVYYVPKGRATGLRPTIEYSKMYPHYLRFAP